VVFLYGSGTSFSALLWQHAWQILIAGLVLLIVWLWMRIPRFGPMVADCGIVRQKYGEELTAAARFLWRKKGLGDYLRPLRERIEAQYQGTPETFYQELSEQSGLSVEEVAEAMTSLQIKDPAQITRQVQKLQAFLK
jgi:hypothetical protein